VNPPPRQVLHEDILSLLVQNDKFSLEMDNDITQGEESFTTKENSTTEVNALGDGHRGVQTMKQNQEEQSTNQGGGHMPPSREVQDHDPSRKKTNRTDEPHSTDSEGVVDAQGNLLAETTHMCQTKPPKMERKDLSGGNEKPPSRGVTTHLIDHHEYTPADIPYLVLPVANAMETTAEDAIFMCHTEPFLPARVAKVIELVQIGDDITVAQREAVKLLISEFADCFALSLSKVNLIPGAVHKLKVPKDTTFHTKIPQCSFNPDQRAFMEEKVDEMLKGGIIRPIHPGDIRCVAPSVLAQKVHENTQGK